MSFYHINDVHAHLDEFRSSGSSCTDTTKGCVGGYSRVKDGTLFYTIFKGEKIADTLNQLGFDAMTLGNHEFDDGDDLLANFLSNLTFPTISSNVHSKNSKLAKNLLPYKVYTKHSLAVLAVTTETTASISNPSNLTILRTLTHRCLTHIGYDKDIELAQQTTDISLIIGGHSHTLLGNMTGAKGSYPTIATNLDGDEVFVVTSYRWGEYLGYIDVEYDIRGKIVRYEAQGSSKEWSKAFDAYASTILGHTGFPLIQTTCQERECTLGDFTADSMEDYRSGVDGAIINSGGIRSEIDAGDITLQQALECFPFGNSIVELTFTGSQLWDIFEGIVSKTNVANGISVTSFVQVSRSIKFTYNPDNASDAPIDLQKSYIISTLDFLATGGDNFWVARSDFVTLDTMDEVWADYVRKVTPISYQLDGRISITSETAPQKGV
ncbi:Metallo-dependent phosphatase-like protein [Cyathus striatus]|nr:Metallo-dependent phosphatase-like protein [Cyathus striatus]